MSIRCGVTVFAAGLFVLGVSGCRKATDPAAPPITTPPAAYEPGAPSGNSTEFSDWTWVELAGGGMRVKLPGTPQVETASFPSDGQTVQVSQRRVSQGKLVWTVNETVWPPGQFAGKVAFPQVLTPYAQGVVEEEQGRLEDRKVLVVSLLPAIDQKYILTQGPQRIEWVVIERHLLYGSEILTLQCTMPADEYGTHAAAINAQTAAFFDSLEVLKPLPPPLPASSQKPE